MGLLLTTSRHSFFNLSPFNTEETGCLETADVCLPVCALEDLAFQIVAYVDGSDKIWFNQEVVEGLGLQQVKAGVCADCNLGEEESFPAQPIHFDVTWQRVVEDTTDIWVGNFTANATAWGVNIGQCFKICMYKYYSGFTGDVSEYLTCTNYCFYRLDDPCHTSVFKYRCNEDSFDFYYEDFPLFNNQIRLPAYLLNMQLPSEEKTYRKSNGQFIKLFERIDEEYDLKIDYVPKHWHTKIKALLAHDQIRVQNSNEFGNLHIPIICREKYDIIWQETEHINAPAKTKVLRSEALHMTNSNCI